MCAIAGLLSSRAENPPDPDVLRLMCRRLTHRGPDGQGLDQEVMELAASIPSQHKLHAFRTKRILKRALADLIPREILARRKRGFDPPR
jgi:asparagine synthetase B (glutamine-hydrolysing)